MEIEEAPTLQKTKTIKTYSDPGHAWGKVSYKELTALGIADKISRCSYQREGFIYLEEDCDLGIYVNAMREKGIVVKFKESWTNRQSKIRNYYSYDNGGKND